MHVLKHCEVRLATVRVVWSIWRIFGRPRVESASRVLDLPFVVFVKVRRSARRRFDASLCKGRHSQIRSRLFQHVPFGVVGRYRGGRVIVRGAVAGSFGAVDGVHAASAFVVAAAPVDDASLAFIFDVAAPLAPVEED